MSIAEKLPTIEKSAQPSNGGPSEFVRGEVVELSEPELHAEFQVPVARLFE